MLVLFVARPHVPGLRVAVPHEDITLLEESFLKPKGDGEAEEPIVSVHIRGGHECFLPDPERKLLDKLVDMISWGSSGNPSEEG